MQNWHRIDICKYCQRPEYYDEFRWLSAHMMCRDCYKAEYQKYYKKKYIWRDLDGKRPTLEEYTQQEEEKMRNQEEIGNAKLG